MKNLILIIIIIILVVLGYLAGFYSYSPYQEWKVERRQRAKFMDKEAPAFTTTTMAGMPWQLSDARGKVVLIDFWASWCPDCIVVIPARKTGDIKGEALWGEVDSQGAVEALLLHRIEFSAAGAPAVEAGSGEASAQHRIAGRAAAGKSGG